MTKAFLIFLVAVATAHAQDVDTRTVKTPEQAIIRFRQACDGELKTLLAEKKLDGLKEHILSRPTLFVDLWTPQMYVAPRHDPAVVDSERLFGTYAAVTGCKNFTWHLAYHGSGIDSGGGIVYIDAVTGKVLYICAVTEG